MTCDEAVAQLWRHLEERDGDVVAADLDEHLGRCRNCCGEAEFAGLLTDLWTRASTDALPPSIGERFEGLLTTLEDQQP